MALFRSCKFKMKNDMRGAACEVPAKRTCGTRDAGLRGAKLRPAAPLRAQIQKSIFRIKRAFWARLGIYFRSGRSLRSTQVRVRTAGLRRREAAARTVPTDRFQLETSPQPSGRACDIEEQPSARGRLRAARRLRRRICRQAYSSEPARLRAAAASCEAAN